MRYPESKATSKANAGQHDAHASNPHDRPMAILSTFPVIDSGRKVTINQLYGKFFPNLAKNQRSKQTCRMLFRIIPLVWLVALNGGCGTSGEPSPERVELDAIFPEKLIASSGKLIARETLQDKFVGIYFSASWCPPCRLFTPKLVRFRNEHSSDFEVVLVGWDRSEDKQRAYVVAHEMPWPALPNKSVHGEKIAELFGVQSIPTLIVVSPDGKVVSTQGRIDVAGQGSAAFEGWLDKHKFP